MRRWADAERTGAGISVMGVGRHHTISTGMASANVGARCGFTSRAIEGGWMMGQGRDGGRLRHSAKRYVRPACHEAGETGIAFFACWGSTEGGKGTYDRCDRRRQTERLNGPYAPGRVTGRERNQVNAALRSRRLYEGDAQGRPICKVELRGWDLAAKGLCVTPGVVGYGIIKDETLWIMDMWELLLGEEMMGWWRERSPGFFSSLSGSHSFKWWGAAAACGVTSGAPGAAIHGGWFCIYGWCCLSRLALARGENILMWWST